MQTVTEPVTLPAGRIKRIHMVGANIRLNKKDGGRRPITTVKCGGRSYHCGSFHTSGSLYSVVSFDKRLSSGAVVWLETKADVALYPMPAKED